ncbi:hypothetical protein UlMin_009512 [Ulmus minor]
MGCGESKHDVATGNTTLLRRKSENTNNNNVNTPTNKTSKDIETVLETAPNNGGPTPTPTNSTPPPPPPPQVEKPEDHDKNSNAKEEKEEEEEEERLISRDSPNHYFSSRKDEELGIDGVSSVKSEYNTPRHLDSKPENKQILLVDQETKPDEQQQNQTPVNVEENVVITKEENQPAPEAAPAAAATATAAAAPALAPLATVAVAADDAKISSPDEEEKKATQNVEEPTKRVLSEFIFCLLRS